MQIRNDANAKAMRFSRGVVFKFKWRKKRKWTKTCNTAVVAMMISVEVLSSVCNKTATKGIAVKARARTKPIKYVPNSFATLLFDVLTYMTPGR